MPTIGIFSDTDILLDNFKKLVSKNTNVIKITNTDYLSKIDVLVISQTTEDWLLDSIKWLISAKEFPEILSWVLVPKRIKNNEEEILLSLGAISTIELNEKFNSIVYSVRNTFYKIKQKNTQSDELLFLRGNIVLVNSVEKKLTKIEYRLMKQLYDNKNTTVSYNDIYQNVWSGSSNYNPDNSRFKIANIIFRLRKIISGTNNLEIITVREKGYMFIE